MKKSHIKLGLKVILLLLVFVLGFEFSEVLAQGLNEGGEGLQIAGTGDVAISNDIDKRPLGDVIRSMVNFFIGFLGFIATIMFVYAGVLWVTAGGNEDQISKAKNIMTYAALGILIVILSFSIVRFVASSAGGSGITCAEDADCPDGFSCGQNNVCEADGFEGGGGLCNSNADCSNGFVCQGGICSLPDGSGCLTSLDCGGGQYCSASGECTDGGSVQCTDNSQCGEDGQCDPFGFCHNPNGGSGAICSDNSDCATGYVCNGDTNTCEVQGTGGAGGTLGGPTQGLSEEAIDDLDETINLLGQDLSDIEDEINSLPEDVQDDLNLALGAGNLADKMASVSTLIDEQDDPLVIAVLNQLLAGLERLQLVREQLDHMRTVMPESEETIAEWDTVSDVLNDLIDDPVSSIKLRRFENNYRELKELVRKFPIVQSKIKAAPARGNVPFTVTFDGLNSVDPTGGTISDYKWSFLDSNGNLVSLGNAPIVTHEFTEPNTYSVKLQVSTTNTDASNYKLAMDGVSVVRVRANPPASQVAYRINGVEARDVYHVTLEEAKAGISFDPSITVPAVGRSIEEYEWIYGDTNSEKRTVASTVIHSYSKAGEYFVTLKVKDSQGVIDKRVIKLVVKSLAANIEFVPETGNVNTEFRFRGINSRSDDGQINEYEWNIKDADGISVATSNQENFYHTFDRPGVYQAELLVTDATGSRDKSTFELEVFSREPVASFTHKIPDPAHPNTVEFNAASSYDPDQGDSITYSWDFDGDGQFEIVDSNDIIATHTYRRTGVYKVNFQVKDEFGQRSTIVKNVTVDSILSADIVLENKVVSLGEPVKFKVVSPNAVAYLWEFGDGEIMNTDEDEIEYTYKKEGKYRVKLNFFDQNDNENVATTFVLVGEADTPIAAAEALVDGRESPFVEDLCGPGESGYIVTRSDNISLTARNSINRDGSSRLLNYDWKFSNGTRNTKKDFVHRFAEINTQNDCSTVSLVVQDEISGKLSKEDVLNFKVVNRMPTILDFVVEGERLKELVTPTKVRLKIIGAKDLDGQIKKYRWWYYREGFETQKLGVHSTSSPQTDMVITAEGQPDVVNKYFFVAEVIDNDNGVYDTEEQFGEISFLEVKNGPNLSPVAEFTVDKTTIAVGDSITFVSKSYDPQGDILPNNAFQWDFDGDGAFEDISTGPVINRQFNTPGEYEVRLKVINRGLSSTARKTVFVEPTNTYPQAAFTYKIEGNTVNFNGNNSAFDPDIPENTLRYEWDFNIQEDANGNGINDDDVQSTEVSPSFNYEEAALYRARLKVKDNLGMEGVVVRDINLLLSESERQQNTRKSLNIEAQNQPLTILNVETSPYQISRGQTADIVAKVQNADNSIYEGMVFFELLEGTGTFSPSPAKATEGKAEAVFTSIDPGKIKIRVTATGTFYGDIIEEIIIDVN